MAAAEFPLVMAGTADTAGPAMTASVQQSAVPVHTVPQTVEVACGPVRGTLLVHKTRVIHEGEEISPTEFEKLGGRAAAKKWKTSLRVVAADGSTRQLVGDWLQAHNFTPPTQRNLGPRAPRLLAAAVGPRPVSGASRPAPTFCSAQEVLAHLDKQFLGLQAGDPTAGDLPQELPATAQEGDSVITSIDVGRVSYDELMRMSASSAADPLRALLPEQPGVLRDRVASITGHKRMIERPVRSHVPAKGSMEAAAALADYLAGRTEVCPWESLGARGPVTVDGKPLDLRQMHKLVSNQGGYRTVCAEKRWGRVAGSLGINKDTCPNCAYLCRLHYQRFLVAHDAQADALQQIGRRDAAAAEQATEASAAVHRTAGEPSIGSAGRTPPRQAGSLSPEQAGMDVDPEPMSPRWTGQQLPAEDAHPVPAPCTSPTAPPDRLVISPAAQAVIAQAAGQSNAEGAAEAASKLQHHAGAGSAVHLHSHADPTANQLEQQLGPRPSTRELHAGASYGMQASVKPDQLGLEQEGSQISGSDEDPVHADGAIGPTISSDSDVIMLCPKTGIPSDVRAHIVIEVD